MNAKTPITVEVVVDRPVAIAWQLWTQPKHMIHWNFADASWHSPKAEANLVVGGKYSIRMEAKDGSMGFDFSGVYRRIVPSAIVVSTLDDDRTVTVEFFPIGDQTRIVETFEAEELHSLELQRQGWQAILDNFKAYAESAAALS